MSFHRPLAVIADAAGPNLETQTFHFLKGICLKLFSPVRFKGNLSLLHIFSIFLSRNLNQVETSGSLYKVPRLGALSLPFFGWEGSTKIDETGQRSGTLILTSLEDLDEVFSAAFSMRSCFSRKPGVRRVSRPELSRSTEEACERGS